MANLTSDNCSPSKNAKVSAVSLVVGAIALSILTFQQQTLAPLRLLTLAVLVFGVWAFCDEMGMRKPLIRAGFVAFAFAVFARFVALVDVGSSSVGRYYLLGAFALLIAILFWSAAYLHRQRDLKVAGALGTFVSLGPILVLIIGHIALGAGAAFGIGSLLAAANGQMMEDFVALNLIDYIFTIWTLATAWFLWSGRIRE